MPQNRTKNIAVLRFWYEGNSFSPLTAGRAHFEAREWVSGLDARQFYKGKGVEVGAVVDFLEAHEDIEATYLRCAAAYPSGPLERGLFAAFLAEAIEGLKGRQWDGVYASLHGASVAEDMISCETILLEEIRKEVGSAVIAASFDLHANLDPRIADFAEIVLGYKTYPHVDMYATGWKAMELLRRALSGEIAPKSLITPAHFVPTSFNMLSDHGPMAEIIGEAARAEAAEGLYDITVFGGFPYADAPNCGASISLCFEEGNTTAAAGFASALVESFRSKAGRFDVQLPPARDVIGRLLRQDGCARRVAVLEPADNIFSGGAGDAPDLLRAVLDLAADVPSVFAFFWDRDLVEKAREAGLSASIPCRFGGRLSPHFGKPVEAAGFVERLTDGKFENLGPMEKGLPVDIGKSAVIRVHEVRIIVTCRNVPVNDPAYFLLHGLELKDFPIVYVKAKNHFRAAFEEAFDDIVECGTRGPAPADISRLPYRHAPLERLRFGRKWKNGDPSAD
ncbi:MAG: M81 family metallopeptidase [Kiloniellales bacterium]|nr:M81 family metallopeptidase [Kiloniellales bacterium]